MLTIEEIIAELKTVLNETFDTVLVSSAQINEQIQQEIRMFGKQKLPAVIITFESIAFNYENTIREISIALVVVDLFTAGVDNRSLQIFEHVESLLSLFPAEGSSIQDFFVIPNEVYAVSSDASYSCFAQKLTIKQGI